MPKAESNSSRQQLSQTGNQMENNLLLSRRRIEDLESVMKTMSQIELETSHTFGPGFYARSITIPKGVTLTGKVHATEHIFMIVKGDITLATEDGQMRVQAPFQMVCRPGLKRAGFAHEETICVNIHITDETDLERLEDALIVHPSLPAPVEQELLL